MEVVVVGRGGDGGGGGRGGVVGWLVVAHCHTVRVGCAVPRHLVAQNNINVVHVYLVLDLSTITRQPSD